MTRSKTLKSEKGVSLIITLFVMIIILSVVLSISALLYSEIKVIRNIGNSVIGLYAADSGIEKVLYYDWQVKPAGDNIRRGLCSMYDYHQTTNPNACAIDTRKSDPTVEHSIYCNDPADPVLAEATGGPTGCDPNVCDNCKISFTSELDDKISYSTEAKVYTTIRDAVTYDMFEINSKGFYGGAGRQIQIVIETKRENAPPQSAPPVPQPTITSLQVECGGSNKISADLYDNDGVAGVIANMYVGSPPGDSLPLQSQGAQGTHGNGNWSKPWSSMDNNTTYLIYLIATDELGNTNTSNTIEACCRANGTSCI